MAKKKHKIKRKELYSLDYTIVEFTLPRLKEFKKQKCGYPSYLHSEEHWDYILDRMVASFELILRDHGTCDWTPEEELQVFLGLNYFKEYFLSLWY